MGTMDCKTYNNFIAVSPQLCDSSVWCYDVNYISHCKWGQGSVKATGLDCLGFFHVT